MVSYSTLVLLALLGHVALGTMLYNRLHATRLPRRLIRVLDKGLLLAVGAGVVVGLSGLGIPKWPVSSAALPSHTAALAYLTLCWAAALAAIYGWARRRWFDCEKHAPMSNHTTVIDVARQLGHRPLGGLSTRLMACIPGNQILHLSVHHKTLVVPQLPPELDNLSIAHLSDLHLTGQLTRPFFDLVVDQTNQFDADLIVITGDIVDKPHCMDWIAGTLGRLRSRLGTYFVLGNHDKRLRDVAALRRSLTAAGLIDLGGRWEPITVGRQPVVLAGNELPWFGPAPELPDGPHLQDAFRILLAHTPDQFAWARQGGFHLMLAGHTHGGQIRLPIIGPLVAPSRYGVQYASGLFYQRPTLMHVSRGISGVDPIRLNCPPELARLILRRQVAAPACHG